MPIIALIVLTIIRTLIIFSIIISLFISPPLVGGDKGEGGSAWEIRYIVKKNSAICGRKSE